jgi:hypothetical protein
MGRTPVMRRLRVAARIAVLVGALGSVVMMLYVARRNPSRVLLVLFAIWDLSPFVALALANRRSPRWPLRAQTMLSIVALVVAVGSLAIYGTVLISPTPKVARVFLMVPLGSWIVILLVVFLARRPAGGANQPR